MKVGAGGTALRFGLSVKLWVLTLFCAAMFVASSQNLKQAPRQSVNVEMQVALPLFVQVMMTAGDRFLAGNVAAIQALVVDNFKMRPDEFAILAKVQRDVSWLNPGHEDNYYIATAILPWRGEYAAAQEILRRAAIARPFDYQPAFHRAFNLLHFEGDAVGASQILREAAEHLPEGNERLQMHNLAAIWIDKAQDIDLAIRVVEALAQQAQRRDFKRYLLMRVERLQALKGLRERAREFKDRYGRLPQAPEELVSAGLIAELPQDPFQFGFAVDKTGQIVLRNSPPPIPNKP